MPTEIELVESLIEQAKDLPYGASSKLDGILRRSEMIIRQIFGEDSHYLSGLKKISFYPHFAPSVNSVKLSTWSSGKNSISNLFLTMKEELELGDKRIMFDYVSGLHSLYGCQYSLRL